MIRKWLSFYEFMVLTAVVGCGLATRLWSWRRFARPDGGFYFHNPDSYDHLRHIILEVQRFPSIALHDTYVGYPVGTGHIWAPLYDYLFSGAAFCFGLDRPLTEALCFFSGPFLYALSILLVFVTMRRLFHSPTGGLAAAMIYTLHPALISYSVPKNFDHHILEPILCLLFIGLPFLEEDDAFRPRRLVLAVGLLVTAIFLWRGATLYWVVAFGSVLLRSVVQRNRALAATYARLFLLAGALLGLYCLVDPLGLGRGVSAALISWFHPALLAGCGAVLLAMARLSLRTLIRCLFSVPVVVLALAPFTQFGRQIYGVGQFLFGFGDPWLASINELHGTFTTYGVADGIAYLTVGYILAPLIVLLAWVLWRREPHGNPLLPHFVAWCALLPLALVYRYAIYSSVVVAMTTAWLVAMLWRRGRGWQRWAAVMLLLAVTLVPSLPIVAESVTNDLSEELRFGMFGPRGVIGWLRTNTPVTSHYLAPEQMPEYGILADWDLGSYLYYDARRPALATPFGWETHGFFEHAAFFAAGSAEKALEIARANRIRYVLVSWNRNMNTYHAIARSGERQGRIAAHTVDEPFSSLDCMYYRLFVQDGSGYLLSDGQRRQALGAFRLVFETEYLGGYLPTNGVTQSYYKVYELVRGAEIRGKTAPGREVALSLSLLTGRGRPFRFNDTVQADARGEYTFRVPYATASRQGETSTGQNYLVTVQGEPAREVRVSEEQVVQGKVVELRN